MRNLLLTGALALITGLAAVSFDTPVGAQDLEIEIDRNGVRLRDGECDPRYERCRDDLRRSRQGRRFCSEGRALDKAASMGIRRARVVSAGRRIIEIRGRNRYGERVGVAFSRERGCPVLR